MSAASIPTADNRVATTKTRTAEAPGSFESSSLRHALNWLVITKIAGLVLVFDPYSLQAFDLPKSLFSRAMEWLIAGVIVCALLRYGFGIVPRSWLHVPIAAFVAANVLSTIFAENTYVALYGEWERYEGLAFVIDMAVLYLAVAIAFRRSDGPAYAVSLCVITIVTLGYAALQYFHLDPISWIDLLQRPFSTFGHSNFFGQYLSVVGGALVAIVAAPKRFLSGTLRASAAVLLIAVLLVASVVATRGTALGIGAALLTALAVAVLLGSNRRIPVPTLLLLAAGLLSLVALTWFFTPLGERMQVIGSDSASKARLFSYESAFRGFLDRPLVGYGPDNLRAIYPRYRQPERAEVAGAGTSESAVHNWILQTAVSTGLVGVASLSATLIVAGATLLKRIRREPQLQDLVLLTAGIAYWVHALVAPVSVSVDWAPWMIFGALVATEPRVVTVAKRSPQRRAIAGVALIAVIIGSLTPLVAASASRNAWVASSLIGEGDSEAILFARSAVNSDPGRAQYWAVLGRAFASQGLWSEAATSFEEAARRAPYEWSRWSDFAIALASGRREVGELQHAMDVGSRAVDLDPYEPAAHAALARLAFMTRANDLALRSAAVAVHLFPSGGYDRLVFTAALLRLEHPGDARRLIRSALERRSTPDLHLALAAVEFQLGNGDAGKTEIELARTQGAIAGDVDRVLREFDK